MDGGSISNYWVKFFKTAGFSTDVATKHALTFTNNRIKPDMLPELDKPSLKEMGITLMGDMIAILRYAKKIVEETTCKTFLVNSEDTPAVKIATTKPVVKKIVPKTATKTSVASKTKSESLTKTVKSVSNTIAKPSVTLKKKVVPVAKTSKLYSDYIETKAKPKTIPAKRKYEISSDEDDERWALKEAEKRRKSNNDKDVDCQIILPKSTSIRNPTMVKKTIEQKKTVFHRLGDSMVSSTTSIVESSNSSFNPTFTVTGVTGGKESQKRNSSVFNRLGNKDSELLFNRNSRNGVTSGTQSILKTRPSMFGTTALTTKPVVKKPVGTMRADEEATRKLGSPAVKQLVRTTKSMKIAENPSRFSIKVPVHGKLASESVILPAKSRLGMSKQVTFNRTATVSHFSKPAGVFSRLGV